MHTTMTQKQQAAQLLDHLPAESTLEDIQYHLYVLEKIKRGQQDIVDGNHFSHEEAQARLKQWL